MHSAVDKTTTQTSLTTSNKTSETEIDAQAFLDELENYMTEPEISDKEKASATFDRLARALPEFDFLKGLSPSLSEAPEFYLQKSSQTMWDSSRVTISEEMLLQMSDDDEMFDNVKEMISGLFSAGNAQQLSPSTGQNTARWQSLAIDVTGTKFTEVLRDTKSGMSTVSALNLRTQELLTDALDLIMDSRQSSSRNGMVSGRSSQRWNFDSILNNSSNWNMELAFSSSTQAMETLRASQATISRIEIVLEQWESSGSSSGDSLLAYMQIAGLTDPLVFDLGGEGINLTSAEDGVYFDIKGDGSPVQTAWITGNNAFLFLDENGNGVADDANELFGDHGGYANGFEKLRQYDSNGDGVIDENDDIYSELRLWRDLNGDGVCQEGEGMTLAEAGISSINLNYNDNKRLDKYGNVIAEESTFTRTDGTTGMVADAWLKSK